MVNKDILLDLYRHMEWADAAVWTAVLADEPQNFRSTPDLFETKHLPGSLR